jgi:hypothetical protein
VKGYAIRVTFGNGFFSDGASVEVNGEDFDWVTGTFERLSASLLKSESWVRGRGRALRYVLPLIVTWALAVGAMRLIQEWMPHGVTPGLAGAVGAAMGVLVAPVGGLLGRLFPRFEVTSPEGKTKATKHQRRVVVLFSVLVGIATLATLVQFLV